jgi:tetratricopeptide (TPR) repeat protein
VNSHQFEAARVLLEQGRISEAEAMYLELSADPSLRAECFYSLGFISWRKQDLGAAKTWFVRCLHEGQNLNARYYLGEIALRDHETDRAIRRFAEVLMLNPQHAGARSSLGRIIAPTVQPEPGKIASSSPRPPLDRPAPVTRLGPVESVRKRPEAPHDPDPASVASVGQPPRPPASTHSTVGRVRLVKLQAVAFNGQPAGKQSLSFRLDIPDQFGSLARSLQLEMRGFRISGGVENGDWIEVDEISRSGDVKVFQNISTGQRVKTRLF